MGNCRLELGRLEEALSCLEQAVDEALKGDRLGQLDPDLIAGSLRSLVAQQLKLGQFEPARTSYERTAEAARVAGIQLPDQSGLDDLLDFDRDLEETAHLEAVPYRVGLSTSTTRLRVGERLEARLVFEPAAPED